MLQLRRILDRCQGVDLVLCSYNTKIRRAQNSRIKQRFGNINLNLFTGNVQGTRKQYKGKNKNSNTWAEGVKVKTWAINKMKCILD